LRHGLENLARNLLWHAHGFLKKRNVLRLKPLLDFRPIRFLRHVVQWMILNFRLNTLNLEDPKAQRNSSGLSLLTPSIHAFIIAAREIGAACGPSSNCFAFQDLNFSFVIQGKDS